jgi:hypothetical protein
LEDIGDFGSNWERGARIAYRMIARSKIGRTWLANYTQIPPELRTIRDEVLENTDGHACALELGILKHAVASFGAS